MKIKNFFFLIFLIFLLHLQAFASKIDPQLDFAIKQTIKEQKASFLDIFTPRRAKWGTFEQSLSHLDANNLRLLLYTTSKLVFLNNLQKRLIASKLYPQKTRDLLALRQIRCEEILKHVSFIPSFHLLSNAQAYLLQNTLNIMDSAISCKQFSKKLTSLDKKYSLQSFILVLRAKIKHSRKALQSFYHQSFEQKGQII